MKSSNQGYSPRFSYLIFCLKLCFWLFCQFYPLKQHILEYALDRAEVSLFNYLLFIILSKKSIFLSLLLELSAVCLLHHLRYLFDSMFMCFNDIYCLLFSTLLKVLNNDRPKEGSRQVGGRVCIRSSMSCTWKNVKKSPN